MLNFQIFCIILLEAFDGGRFSQVWDVSSYCVRAMSKNSIEEIAKWDLLCIEEEARQKIFKSLTELLTKMREAIKEEIVEDG